MTLFSTLFEGLIDVPLSLPIDDPQAPAEGERLCLAAATKSRTCSSVSSVGSAGGDASPADSLSVGV